MFGIGLPELILIMIVALLVVGPKKLPDLARSIGKALHQVKSMTDDVKQSFEEVTADDFEEPGKAEGADTAGEAGDTGPEGVGDPYLTAATADESGVIGTTASGEADLVETAGISEPDMAGSPPGDDVEQKMAAKVKGSDRKSPEDPPDPSTAAESGGYGDLRG